MRGSPRQLWTVYGAALAASTALATWMLFFYAPVEKTMGPIQKMFYVHLPFAINAFLACLAAFVGGVGYLWQRRMKWDDLSSAAAKVAAMMCTVVLITGMIWGRYAWGKWWDWDSHRLIFSLLLWLLYVVYLILRPSIESRQRRAAVCAVYAVAAFLDIPLMYLSAKLIPDVVHPQLTELAPQMKLTLAVWFVPVTLLMIGLVVVLTRATRRARSRADAAGADAAWSLSETGPTKP
jgi:heme exporter protein C